MSSPAKGYEFSTTTSGTERERGFVGIVPSLKRKPRYSLDVLREEMKILPTESSTPVVARAKEIAKGYLRKKQAFVWNASPFLQNTLFLWHIL